MARREYRPGDRVVRVIAPGGFGREPTLGDMAGSVVRVTPKGRADACVRVRWDNGHESLHAERHIARVESP